MSTIFALMFLLCAGLLIIGLVSPKKVSKFANKPLTRKEAGVGFGLATFAFFVLTGITAPQQSAKVEPDSTQQASKIQSNSQDEAEVRPIIKTVIETQPINYSTKTIQDPSISQGISSVSTKGVLGVKTLTYEVTTLDGKEKVRKLIKEEVTKQPVTEIVNVGTKTKKTAAAAPKTNCDPNYSGACVPIASDVDCSSGSGNGPAYVRGPVKVIGTDIYDLDRDGNGTGCENG